MFIQKPVKGEFDTETVPAPVGGINAFDSLAAMPETDAIIMQNWWPQPYGCSIRKGYLEWTTGMPSSVESLASWSSITGATKLFAWSGTAMYDCTTRGAVGAAIVTALSNARWETTSVTNSGGSNLICVNGLDDGIIYRTAGVARLVAGDGIVTNTWAGLNPNLAVQVINHQSRLWAVEKESTRGWYLPVNAVQGTFVSFDFGPIFSKGGNLQFLATWTIDDGNGAEDHLVAVSSEGEAVVYGGTDPSSVSTWGLVGVYFLGSAVIGRRGFTKAGGDLLLLTQQGVVSMMNQLASTKVNQSSNILVSRKIQFLISELISSFSAVNGWNLSYFPSANMLIVAVPSIISGGNVQLVSNLITEAWSQFSGMDGVSWIVYKNNLYFGDYSGRLYQAWTGYIDNVLLDNTGGTGIVALVQQAYAGLGARSRQKQVGLTRPTFVSSGIDPSYNLDVVYDYADEEVPTPGISPATGGGIWNLSLWGEGVWSGGSEVTQNWRATEGLGAMFSLKMVVNAASEVLWVSTDYTVRKALGIF